MKKEPDLGLFDEVDAQIVDQSANTQVTDTSKDVIDQGWIGIETNHRRLFDASQRGWFEPLENGNLCLGCERFIVETDAVQDGVIPVQLSFELRELPIPIADECVPSTESENEKAQTRSIVQCTTPLPLYAIRSIDVCSPEHQTRLLAMSRNFSNVSLPIEKIRVVEFATADPIPTDLSSTAARQWHLPESIDAVHGAIAMSIWAVPRVQPWIEVLRLALTGDTREVDDATDQLGVPWLKLPWLTHGAGTFYEHGQDITDQSLQRVQKGPTPESDTFSDSGQTTEQPATQGGDTSASVEDDTDSHLWQAAIQCMQQRNQDRVPPTTIAKLIAEKALAHTGGSAVASWLNETLRILAAEQSIKCDPSTHYGAGLAIQLVLLQPDPRNFKTWSTSLPGLPPAVWWAAATLCGWQHGYKSLDRNFRGDSGLQRFTAVRALAACSSMDEERLLPECQRSPIRQVEKKGWFVLSWCGSDVIRKQWQGRAKWYAHPLTDQEAIDAAQVLAQRLSCPCVESWLKLPEGEITTEGSGELSIKGDSIIVENGVRNLRLSDTVKPVKRIDRDAFRHLLVTGAGFVTDPPESGIEESGNEIPGLIYRPDFITPAEETRLVEWIDEAPWRTELKRRVQHYGWRYDYKQRSIDESMRIGPLPDWAQALAERLVRDGLMRHLADQLIVNEYCETQGISKHCDQPSVFEDEVATVSLLETWGMVFRRRKDKHKVEIPLENRSVTVLTKDARYKWTHEIPSRKFENAPDDDGQLKRIKRSRRISLTFRKTRTTN